MRRDICSILIGLSLAGAACAQLPEIELASAHVLVTDDATGTVLLAKAPQTSAPIASLTKLLTAMVVLDARASPQQELRITTADLDRLKHTRGGVPVGTALPRATLIDLALVASDNRATSALARHYRSGLAAFRQAMQRKIRALGLSATQIEEPTGLSPNNMASAEDIARVLKAAARYPQIARSSSQPVLATTVAGRPWEVRNTNAWVGLPGWEVSLSKTGYIREAGLCLGMRLRVGDRLVNVVLMGAPSAADRALDVQNIAYWLSGQPLVARPRPAVERQAPAETAPAQPGDIADGGDTAAASTGTDPAIPHAQPDTPAPSTPTVDDAGPNDSGG